MFSDKSGRFKDGTNNEFKKVDTVIGPDCVFQGIILLKNSIAIEGSVKGKIESKGAVVIGRDSIVEADIIADNVVVNGAVKGNIAAYEQLDIGKTGRIHGNVEAKHVTISKGGLLDGFCHMINEESENERLTDGASAERATLEPGSNGRWEDDEEVVVLEETVDDR